MATRTVSYSIHHEIEVDVDDLKALLGRNPTIKDIREEAFNKLGNSTGNIIYGGMSEVEIKNKPVIARKIIRSLQSY